MDTLRSLRQPVAWVMIGAAVANGLISLVMTLAYLDRGVARAAQTWSGSVLSVTSAALVLAAVLSLVLIAPRPPQTKLLVTVGLVVVAGLGIVSLIGAFVGLADIGGGGAALVVWFLRRLVDLAVIAAIAFVLLRAMMAVTSGPPTGAGTGTATQVAEPTGYLPGTAPPQHATHQQPGHQQPAHQQPAHQQPAHQQPAHQQPAHQQSAPQPGGWGTPQSLPPQGPPTPHSLPPQPQPHQQHPYQQGPQQGPTDGGPPEDYTRIAPHRCP